MITILHLDSSAKKEGSVTRKLTATAVEKLKSEHSDAKVIYRDLAADPLDHINSDFLNGIFKGGEFASHYLVKLSDKLIEEIKSADVIVIGAPMYNFSVPSTLKAWIDYICRAGITFRYTETGPIGLITNKKAIVAVANGGLYSEGPMTEYDHVSPFMKQVLGFIGIVDVKIIQAENQARGPELANKSFEKAEEKIIEATR